MQAKSEVSVGNIDKKIKKIDKKLKKRVSPLLYELFEHFYVKREKKLKAQKAELEKQRMIETDNELVREL